MIAAFPPGVPPAAALDSRADSWWIAPIPMPDPPPTDAQSPAPAARASTYASEGYGQPAGTQTPMTIVVLGICGFLFGPLGGFAWYYGKQYLDACRDENLRPDPNAQVGMYLGIITFLLFCIGIGMALLMVVMWVVMFVVFFGFYLLVMVLALLASV